MKVKLSFPLVIEVIVMDDFSVKFLPRNQQGQPVEVCDGFDEVQTSVSSLLEKTLDSLKKQSEAKPEV